MGNRLKILAEIRQLPLAGCLLNLLDQPGRHGNELPPEAVFANPQAAPGGSAAAWRACTPIQRYLSALDSLLDVRPQTSNLS